MEENNNNNEENSKKTNVTPISLWKPNQGRRNKKLTNKKEIAKAKASLINNPLYNTGRISSDSGLPIIRLQPNPHKMLNKQLSNKNVLNKQLLNKNILKTKLSNSISDINDAFRNADTIKLQRKSRKENEKILLNNKKRKLELLKSTFTTTTSNSDRKEMEDSSESDEDQDKLIKEDEETLQEIQKLENQIQGNALKKRRLDLNETEYLHSLDLKIINKTTPFKFKNKYMDLSENIEPMIILSDSETTDNDNCNKHMMRTRITTNQPPRISVAKSKCRRKRNYKNKNKNQKQTKITETSNEFEFDADNEEEELDLNIINNNSINLERNGMENKFGDKVFNAKEMEFAKLVQKSKNEKYHITNLPEAQNFNIENNENLMIKNRHSGANQLFNKRKLKARKFTASMDNIPDELKLKVTNNIRRRSRSLSLSISDRDSQSDNIKESKKRKRFKIPKLLSKLEMDQIKKNREIRKNKKSKEKQNNLNLMQSKQIHSSEITKNRNKNNIKKIIENEYFEKNFKKEFPNKNDEILPNLISNYDLNQVSSLQGKDLRQFMNLLNGEKTSPIHQILTPYLRKELKDFLPKYDPNSINDIPETYENHPIELADFNNAQLLYKYNVEHGIETSFIPLPRNEGFTEIYDEKKRENGRLTDQQLINATNIEIAKICEDLDGMLECDWDDLTKFNVNQSELENLRGNKLVLTGTLNLNCLQFEIYVLLNEEYVKLFHGNFNQTDPIIKNNAHIFNENEGGGRLVSFALKVVIKDLDEKNDIIDLILMQGRINS